MFWFWVVSAFFAGSTIGILAIGLFTANQMEMRIPE
ncbi:hypothetical protein BH09CHL1_BH09CHL1_04800 [soil metagenome]